MGSGLKKELPKPSEKRSRFLLFENGVLSIMGDYENAVKTVFSLDMKEADKADALTLERTAALKKISDLAEGYFEWKPFVSKPKTDDSCNTSVTPTSPEPQERPTDAFGMPE